uniref:Major facilitator superfamily domain-containing protein 10 n=1 Tax=Cacopsylla melanoneura TaxID=428564 RepID=A0A8D8R2W4_9HEMI
MVQLRSRTLHASVTELKDEAKVKDVSQSAPRSSPAMYIVFFSLLLDLLAFTMILPLMPSLLDHYRLNDSPNGLYLWLQHKVKYFQILVGAPDEFNAVLFGGFLGSMFSFLQFLTSPIVGAMSDVFGRKPVMLLCLFGITSSYILWTLSHSFAMFVFARFVGGLSKGNVSLSMAIVTDVSTVAQRGVGMALVGIAFSVGFILGPLIGAIFAKWSQSQEGDWFVMPAMFALGLSVLDILFVIFFFKESLPKDKRSKSVAKSMSQALAYINITDLFRFTPVRNLPKQKLEELRGLGLTYFVYLFLYSGLEFTLTFLTHHKFHYSSMQQGWMFFGIGLTMAVLQGSWVRRLPSHSMKKTSLLGLLLIIPAFFCVGMATSQPLLYTGLFLFAVSTSMVVPSTMTLVSQFGTDAQKGTVMGIFRSLGALARAFGPVVASICYWSFGATVTYCLGGACLFWPWYNLRKSTIK